MSELLRVQGLVKSFGGIQAVKGLDFAIEEGRCVALLGPNGAGKTTTIRMLTGLLKPTAGEMKFHGVPKDGDQRSIIGYLPQTPAFLPWMTGLEFVVYAGRLCGLSSGEAKRRGQELLEKVGLAGAEKRRVRGYSGGMKQRLGLAQALVHRPKLLIMDEPVSALDPLGRREVLGLLRELKRETTVLFSTHVLHDAEELCDDVMIIRNGQIAMQGALNDIRVRHRKPVIELRVERDERSEKWLSELVRGLSAGTWDAAGRLSAAAGLFEEAEMAGGGAARLIAKDVDAARELLLESMAKERIKVAQLAVGYSSLEDLFMKAVSE